MHSLVSELGFFAFLQSSWRRDVEHGVLLLLMVLKKNISSASWHVLIICESKMSARFGVGKVFFPPDQISRNCLGSKMGKRSIGGRVGTGYNLSLGINLALSLNKSSLQKTTALGGSSSLFLWCYYLWLYLFVLKALSSLRHFCKVLLWLVLSECVQSSCSLDPLGLMFVI